MKLLEIGLGCGMSYGPGASSLVWPELFPNGKIWFAEYEESCIKNYWNETSRFNYVVGDQSDRGVLEEWVAKTGGNFDYIIDDGGHTNPQIWNSFDVLFNTALKPEGVYFIEDLNVGRFDPWYADGLPTNNGSVVLDVLLDWADQDLSKKTILAPAAATRKLLDQMLFLLATSCTSSSSHKLVLCSVIVSQRPVETRIAGFGLGKVDLSKKTHWEGGTGKTQNCWTRCCFYWQPFQPPAAPISSHCVA
ncbi:hypothetical protein Ndes2437B_g01102 [Nannochloris sp. 'desiccata']